MKRNIIAFVVLTTIYSCANDQKNNRAVEKPARINEGIPSDTLKYKYDSVKFYGKAAVSNEPSAIDTAKAVITYPVFKDPETNQFLEQRILGLSGKQDVFKTYKQLANSFIKEYDTYKATNSASKELWFQLIRTEVKANYPNYISLLVTYSDYKGGAHPNTLLTFINYNPGSHHSITLDSLITAEGMPKLTAVAENIFRRNENLAPNASLSEGYFFNDGVFSLPETFTVTKDGLKFLYNPYEIKSYAAGITELTVPFSKINDIMKPSSILINFK